MLNSKKWVIYIPYATIFTVAAYYWFEPHFLHAMVWGAVMSYGFADRITQGFTRLILLRSHGKKH